MGTTKIDWTDAVWNPVTGCTKYSAGCKNCYAERMANRLRAMGQKKYANGFGVTTHSDALAEPLTWRNPRRVFICSMADLFHEDVPFEFIDEVFEVICKTPHHSYLALTKRAERMAEYADHRAGDWPVNCWAGVTIECDEYVRRADLLRKIPAAVRFVSAEPLIGPLTKLDLTGIDQVIVGGEAGPGARFIDPDWVRDARDRCVSRRVAFFFKQWGGTNKKKTGKMLDGRTWDEMPPSQGGAR